MKKVELVRAKILELLKDGPLTRVELTRKYFELPPRSDIFFSRNETKYQYISSHILVLEAKGLIVKDTEKPKGRSEAAYRIVQS